MAFVKGSLGEEGKVKEYTDGLEGRIDSAFKEVEDKVKTTSYPITLINNWRNVGSAWGEARCVVYGDIVHLTGLITGGTTGSNIGVLPANARFSKGIKRFPVVTSASQQNSYVEISNEGVMRFAFGEAQNVDLSSITFIKG